MLLINNNQIKIFYINLFTSEYNLKITDRKRIAHKRNIQNLKCFYNFFTNSKMEFRSKIFSDNEVSFIIHFEDYVEKVELKKIEVAEDEVENHYVDFNKLKRKKKRITSNLQLMYENYNKKKEHFLPKEIAPKSQIINFCNLKRIKCKNCNQNCTYSIKHVEKLKKALVDEELHLHGHPKNRKFGKKSRTVKQARDELIEHYRNIHKIN
jgi:hypothetical protein